LAFLETTTTRYYPSTRVTSASTQLKLVFSWRFHAAGIKRVLPGRVPADTGVHFNADGFVDAAKIAW
jgi:hypothetical protein